MRIILWLSILSLLQAGYAQSSSNAISSIKQAKIYFNTQEANNILLLRTVSSQDNIAFIFEGDKNNQIILNIVISSIVLNADTWRAYITYSDSTTQEVSYLGTSLDIADSDIQNSPYSDCPLTSLLTFTSKVPGKVTYMILGRDSDSLNFTSSSSEVTSSHSIPIIGLYDNFKNTVIITFKSPDGIQRASQTLSIQTVNTNEARLNVTVNKLSRDNPHFFLLGATIYDEQGYVRWFMPTTGFAFPLSGKLIAQLPGYDLTKVIINEYSGKRVKEYTLPNNAHHDVREKTPGGNLLVLTQSPLPYLGDLLHEIDRTTGDVVKKWDFKDYFDKDRPKNWIATATDGDTDWLHANTISYDPTDNTLLLSSRAQDMVAKIGYDDGTVKWILGNHNDWEAPYCDYLLTPVNFNTTLHPDQDWAYLQHHPTILPNGDILIFDNGGTRPGFTNDMASELETFYKASPFPYATAGTDAGYARIVQYRVNETAMTVTKVLEHTDFPNNPVVIVGSVQYLEDGIAMTGYGEVGKLRISNITSGEVLFAGDRDFFYRAYPMSTTFMSEDYNLLTEPSNETPLFSTSLE